jgi:hypothetical protein
MLAPRTFPRYCAVTGLERWLLIGLCLCTVLVLELRMLTEMALKTLLLYSVGTTVVERVGCTLEFVSVLHWCKVLVERDGCSEDLASVGTVQY